jgi:hypothetical protein
MSSACINPFVYGYLNETFRKEFIDIGQTVKAKINTITPFLKANSSTTKPPSIHVVADTGMPNYELNLFRDLIVDHNTEAVAHAQISPNRETQMKETKFSINTNGEVAGGRRISDASTMANGILTSVTRCSTPSPTDNSPPSGGKRLSLRHEIIPEECSSKAISSCDLETRGSSNGDLEIPLSVLTNIMQKTNNKNG